ncbi:MAG: M42 family metallopeptidase [Aureispira sp.]|nr:M42 family metallopeptidase [Aureispira sp.]
MIDVKLLTEICKISAAPGFEQRLREYIVREVAPYVDEVTTDAMGNVYALKKGTKQGDEARRVMIGSHMDEIGFIVTHIEDGGFLRFHTLGGFDPKTLTAQRVIIHGTEDIIGVMGSKPVHLMSPSERTKAPAIKDYFIDTGMTKEEVEKIVSVGDPITRERGLIEMGNCVNSKSLDNRLAVYILFEAFRELQGKDVPYDVYGVFTVQEEVGIRGASVAAQQVNPHFGFGIDVTIAFDLPGAQAHEKITSLGEGVAIKIMDSSLICDYRMVKFMKETADKHAIKWQPEVLTGGGTDTAGIQRRGIDGAIAGAISIPCRHVHQVIEMSDKDDIRGGIDLLKHSLLEIDKYDWSFK